MPFHRYSQADDFPDLTLLIPPFPHVKIKDGSTLFSHVDPSYLLVTVCASWLQTFLKLWD